MINIIGGGPAGLYTAYLLAREGKRVNVFEEHEEIGLPIQCTGIITSHLKDFIDIKKEFLVNELDTAKVSSKNDSVSFNLRYNNYVVDRSKFDKYLGSLAKEAGAKIFLSHKFIERKKKSIIVKDIKNNSLKEFENDILIGADGPMSKVSELINKKHKKEFYFGAQARVKLKNNKNVFETFLGEDFPEFFGWIVPENASTARIGLASKKRAGYYLKKFLERKEINKKDIIEYQGGIIPLFNSRYKITDKKRRIYLIGDSAIHVKATTGGGVIPLLTCSKILKDSIINGKDYEKSYRKTAKKNLFIGLKIRLVLNEMSDKDFDFLIRLCKNKKVKSLIEKFDREYPSKFVFKIFFYEPRFFYFLRYFYAVLRSK